MTHTTWQLVYECLQKWSEMKEYSSSGLDIWFVSKLGIIIMILSLLSFIYDSFINYYKNEKKRWTGGGEMDFF